MKKEVYRCLRALEAYKVGLMNMWVNGYIDSAGSLQKQYSNICKELKKFLSEEEANMIQTVDFMDLSMAYDQSSAKLNLINKLVVASEVTIAYLRSLDMHLIMEVTKKEELTKKELELQRKEEALKVKTDEVESMRKVYQELVNIKRGLPELIRSTIIEEIKKSHREIEKHTNPNTKSQQPKQKINL